MGRAERRMAERRNRIKDRKGKIPLSHDDINKIKRDVTDDATQYSFEVLMTMFALTNHRLYGHGKQRILKSLQQIDDLMGEIVSGEATIDDFRQQLKDEVGLEISCK